MDTDMNVEYQETEKFLELIRFCEDLDQNSSKPQEWFVNVSGALEHVRKGHSSRSDYALMLHGIATTLVSSRTPDLFYSYEEWEEWSDLKRLLLKGIHDYMEWLRSSSWIHMPTLEAWSQPFRFRMQDEQKEAYYGA